ncbi:MAG: bacteriohemerythrin [Rhodospirillum sp.]|nr:bacteriohemerythrin [Rhodospirillum sp.]MCF8488659.1 bacteriohemerythrin [Rhodospirillum sp.]MCF8501736.1 bacteriohemerythrin [Rhodospirillum sp.]
MTLKDTDARAVAERGTPLIVWREDWNLGIPGMDRDHRILVSLINQIPLAFGGAEERVIVTSVLNGLWDYTDFHFAREEAVLAAAGYVHGADHAARHEDLKVQVLAYVEGYAKDPDAVDVGDLLAFMERWLIDHILVEDMRYVDAVRLSPGAENAADHVQLVDDGTVEDFFSQLDA